MLKIEQIDFTNKDGQQFILKGYQIEFFPIVGGEETNTITSKVWNQHGDTYLNSFMESYENEIIFAIHSAIMNDEAIAKKRLEIADFFNPLAGLITMEVTLNTGGKYKRDFSLTAAPIFPVGIENRNLEFFKVQLLYEAHTPFWYSSNTIVNSFQGVEPLFSFPFEMSITDPIEFGLVKPDNLAYNEGHVEAPVTIRIEGACINPVITNKTTGEFIKFKNLTMIASDILEIDTTFGQKKVLLNGDNVFNKLDFSSTFFNLKRGGNEIDFDDETGSTEATILFIYRNLFITI